MVLTIKKRLRINRSKAWDKSTIKAIINAPNNAKVALPNKLEGITIFLPRNKRALIQRIPRSLPIITAANQTGKSAFALGGLLMDLQDLLGRRVDVVTPNALHPAIREEVLKEAIDL